MNYFNILEKLENRNFFDPKSKILFDRAKGHHIWDSEGQKYLDLCAGFGALPFGHNPDFLLPVWENLQKEIPSILHGMGDVYASTQKASFLKNLDTVTPAQIDNYALCLSGSQSVEIALKTAELYTGKNKFLAFKNGYHGLDSASLAVTGINKFKNPFMCEDKNTTFLNFNEDLPKDLGGEYAAVIFEPIQGRGGVITPKEGFLEEVIAFSRKNNLLVIADEILTGFCRTGKWFYTQDLDVDILCMGKAVSGGMPLSVCGAKKEVMNAWPKSTGEALHTGTFFGHPLSCQIADRNISFMKENISFDLISEVENLLRDEFKDRVVGSGMMLALKDVDGVRMMERLRSLGVIALAGGEGGQKLSLTPALNFPISTLKTEVIPKIHKLL